MEKKILVTGGAGFIGSNFIRYLYARYPQYRIFNLDLLTYAGNLANLKDIASAEEKKPLKKRRYYFIKGDICDPRFVGALFKKHRFDIVVNFAAESHVDRSITDDYHFFRTNLAGVHNLISLVRKYEIPRFVQISTDEIYGEVLKGSSNESHPIRPSNPYAASKAAADIVVQSYIRTHKLPMLIVRGSNNFGPYQYPEKLIPLCITNFLEGNVVPIHGDGLQVRKWIHVEDFCRGIDVVMHQAKDFSVYNIAGIEMSNISVVKAIAKMLGKNPDEFIYHINDRPGGDQRYAPDSSALKKDFGWDLQLPIHKSLPAVIEWYLTHSDWWKNIKKKKDFKVYYEKQFKSEY